MKNFLCASALALAALAGCKSDGKVEADNTAKNERDTKTADEAVTTKSDLEVTQEIRQAVMADDSLSFEAQNAKIVVNEGTVTLVGPVKTPAEKATMERIAMNVAGKRSVTNQLEVSN